MRKLIFCCLCVFALVACGERNAIMGRWAMEIDETGETSFTLPDDTICSPELRFEYDTIYMDVRSDGEMVRSDFVGIYHNDGDQLKIVDRMGKEQQCKFVIKDDLMTVVDKDNPDKIIMQLRRIKENGS
jgi:hypothetical protein